MTANHRRDQPGGSPDPCAVPGPRPPLPERTAVPFIGERWREAAVLEPFPRVTNPALKDDYTTHFRQQHLRWTYRRVLYTPARPASTAPPTPPA